MHTVRFDTKLRKLLTNSNVSEVKQIGIDKASLTLPFYSYSKYNLMKHYFEYYTRKAITVLWISSKN